MCVPHFVGVIVPKSLGTVSLLAHTLTVRQRLNTLGLPPVPGHLFGELYACVYTGFVHLEKTPPGRN
jgi:hypothetical protein